MANDVIRFDVVSRKEAKRLNSKRFYTGKPCKYGHFSQNYFCGEASSPLIPRFHRDDTDTPYSYMPR